MKNNTYVTKVWKTKAEKYDDYWNDPTIGGVFNEAADRGEYLYLEQYLNEQGLIVDFEKCLNYLNKLKKCIKGNGAELASGIQWLTAYLIKRFGVQIDKFYSIDYSEKNIFNLGQRLLEYYKICKNKLILCLGSFYEIKLPNENLDFIIMSQAFHHADNPDKLLQEVHRVLKKDGFLIMIGELFISKTRYFKCYLNYVISLIVSSKYFPYLLVNRFSIFKRLKLKKLIGSFQEIYFPPDPVLGDHYYLKSQYEKFFSRNGFNFYRITSKKSNHLAYIIFKK